MGVAGSWDEGAGSICNGLVPRLYHSLPAASATAATTRTVISTGANLAQGAANCDDYFWPRWVARNWGLTSAYFANLS